MASVRAQTSGDSISDGQALFWALVGIGLATLFYSKKTRARSPLRLVPLETAGAVSLEVGDTLILTMKRRLPNATVITSGPTSDNEKVVAPVAGRPNNWFKAVGKGTTLLRVEFTLAGQKIKTTITVQVT